VTGLSDLRLVQVMGGCIGLRRKQPVTPASSYVSRTADSAILSSISHPPLGSIHVFLRLAEINSICEFCKIGTQPVTCRTPPGFHRWCCRPCRDCIITAGDDGAVVVVMMVVVVVVVWSPPQVLDSCSGGKACFRSSAVDVAKARMDSSLQLGGSLMRPNEIDLWWAVVDDSGDSGASLLSDGSGGGVVVDAVLVCGGEGGSSVASGGGSRDESEDMLRSFVCVYTSDSQPGPLMPHLGRKQPPNK
jgi:hypothetical protein